MDNKVVNPHDHFFKQTLARPEMAAEFFRLYLPPRVVALFDLQRVERGPDSFIDKELQEHLSDALFRVGLRNGGEAFIYVLLEHKSAPDEWVALQLLRYLVRIWEQTREAAPDKKLPLVFPVVFYHGRRKWKVAENFAALFDWRNLAGELHDYVPEFRYHLFDLARYDDEDLTGQPVLAATLRLLKHVFRADLKEQLPEALRLIISGELPTDDELEAVRLMLAYLRAAKRIREPEFNAAFRAVLQERGMNMEETFIDRWIRQGMQQGLQKGEVTFALRALRRRFGTLAPQLETQINLLSPPQLESLAEALFDFRTLEDLTAWLQEHGPEVQPMSV